MKLPGIRGVDYLEHRFYISYRVLPKLNDYPRAPLMRQQPEYWKWPANCRFGGRTQRVGWGGLIQAQLRLSITLSCLNQVGLPIMTRNRCDEELLIPYLGNCESLQLLSVMCTPSQLQFHEPY